MWTNALEDATYTTHFHEFLAAEARGAIASLEQSGQTYAASLMASIMNELTCQLVNHGDATYPEN